MCTRKSTRYLQCGHRKYENTDTSSCDYYDPKRYCCPKNEDVVKEDHRLCSDCEAQLRQTSYYLHFKVRNLGDEYVDYDWSAGNSPIFSQNSEDYDERFREMQMEEGFDTMSMDLPTISEEGYDAMNLDFSIVPEEGFDAMNLDLPTFSKEKEKPNRIKDVWNIRLRLLKHQKSHQ